MYIMCSIGPKVNNIESISELHKAGMNAVRYNFSHIDYNRTKRLIDFVKLNYPDIKVFQDLQGNKLRVGAEFDCEIMVRQGERVFFCSQESYHSLKKAAGNILVVPIAFEGEFSAIYSAKTILMKDATMKFKVIKRPSKDSRHEMIDTIVEVGGVIRGEKGINAPGMSRKGIGLTKKDRGDILWGLENKVDMICLSYVCSSEIILEMKKFIKDNNRWGTEPEIWAKIESREGLRNIHSITSNVQGIMLGRGDLLAEVDPILIPNIQDKLINIVKRKGKELVVATYVLSSMKNNHMPLISELDDIYYFIKKGVTGFMLSTEVSIGRHPVKVVETLKKMIDRYSRDEGVR